MSVVPNGRMNQDATWYGGGPRQGDIVLNGNPAPLLPKRAQPQIFQRMSVVAKWPDA